MIQKIAILSFLLLAIIICPPYRQLLGEPLKVEDKIKEFIVNDSIDTEKIKKHIESGKMRFSSLRGLLTKITNSPLRNKVRKVIMWKMTAPDGSQHWLFGAPHAKIPLRIFPRKSNLFVAIEKATIFMPENASYLLSVLNKVTKKRLAASRLGWMINTQITMAGNERKRKLAQLDTDLKLVKKCLDEFRAAETSNILEASVSKDKIISYQLNRAYRLFNMNLAYINGNLSKFTHFAKLRKHQDILLNRRNAYWVKKRIIPICKGKESCLIYPGVSHLYEDEASVVSLLQKEGFAFQRVD